MKCTPFLFSVLVVVTVSPRSSAAEAFSVTGTSDAQIVWTAESAWSSVKLRVSSDVIAPHETTFSSGQTIRFSTVGLPDGTYQWELTGVSGSVSPTLQAQIKAARAAGNETLASQLASQSGITSATGSGSFNRSGGVNFTPATATPSGTSDPSSEPGTLDVVVPDDQIIQGSLAVGFDAIDGESFGFDTIRLKENNTRLAFFDTSSSAGFSGNDWAIEANDAASGGASYLGFRDRGATGGEAGSGGTLSFRIQAGASEGALWVDSSNRVGLGTTTPILHLHMADSNTPAMRLEQNGGGGFTPQTWDVAGNEANFFVRDVTGGSRLPFRIRPGAPTSSIDISASGDVGLGTASPAASLHITGSDGTTKVRIEETSGTLVGRSMLDILNNGPTKYKLVNTAASTDLGGGGWQMNAKNGFQVQLQPATPTPGVTEFLLERGGKLTISGAMFATAFNTTSDRKLKHQIEPVTPREVLKKVVALPIEEWSFIGDESSVRHIGPMAQDFKQQFGLGQSETTINLMDSTGVALAAIQGLHEEVAARDAQIKELRSSSEEMAAQIKLLMEQVKSLKEKSN